MEVIRIEHVECLFADDMYQILSHLPEDVAFNCRVCYPLRPAPWEALVNEEMQAGFMTIMQGILAMKSSQHLTSVQDEVLI